MEPAFQPGDIIQVLAPLCRHVVTTGLTGFIESSQLDEKAQTTHWTVQLLRTHKPEDNAQEQEEARGDFHSWRTTGPKEKLRRLPEKHPDFARTKTFRDKIFDPVPKEVDPGTKAFIKDYLNPENTKARKAFEAKLAEESKVHQKDFILPGGSKRGNKRDFLHYQHPTIQKWDEELRLYASEPVEKRTLAERARWKIINKIIEKVSFWSGHPEVRDLVFELDLDPLRDTRHGALYQSPQHTTAPVGSLRNIVIPLWNQGYEILEIDKEDDEDPTGEFSITYAQRQKLPTP